ncbi:MAG: sugar phosphate isomerase/epimerase family protein [Armatimonadota bacterium]
MGSPRVAVQLIIFGERPTTDLAGVLADVRSAGYDGFEGGGLVTREDLAKTKPAVDGAGIAFLGGHYGADQMADPAAVESYAALIAELGGRYMMVSGGAETLDDYRRQAKLLNAAGEASRRAGVSLCYHNHFWEFSPIDGQVPMHILTQETDPEFVKLCPDIYWVYVGGKDPAQFLSHFGTRCPCIHFKDGLGGDQPREFRELGRGNVDIPAALEAARKCNPDWIIVEQDETKGDPAESCRVSREYLRALGL